MPKIIIIIITSAQTWIQIIWQRKYGEGWKQPVKREEKETISKTIRIVLLFISKPSAIHRHPRILCRRYKTRWSKPNWDQTPSPWGTRTIWRSRKLLTVQFNWSSDVAREASDAVIVWFGITLSMNQKIWLTTIIVFLLIRWNSWPYPLTIPNELKAYK